MASFDVFDSFLIIKTSQEWRRTWYSPWQSKIEARLHEESKFWRASKPFPNQSSMQGRESEKEFTFVNFATSCEIFASLWISHEWISQPLAKFSQAKKEFHKPCETDEFRKPWETDEFCNPLWNFRNLAKSSCNLKIFLHRLR